MRIKEYRKQQGLTQKDLAMHSGVNIRTIRRIENCEQSLGNLSLNTAMKIAWALGITIEELTGEVFKVEEKFYYENEFKPIILKESGK